MKSSNHHYNPIGKSIWVPPLRNLPGMPSRRLLGGSTFQPLRPLEPNIATTQRYCRRKNRYAPRYMLTLPPLPHCQTRVKPEEIFIYITKTQQKKIEPVQWSGCLNRGIRQDACWPCLWLIVVPSLLSLVYTVFALWITGVFSGGNT